MRARLSWMMALVYAVQGAFWPVLAVHLKDLGIGGHERGWIFATLAIGSLAMPLGVGQLVDRLVPSQYALSAIYSASTGFLIVLALGLVTETVWIFALFLGFWMIASPAFALSNTIAMRHLERPYEQFAGVRLWGTVGWMAVGWAVSLVMVASGSARTGQGAYEAFWVAAVLSMILSVYALTLPHTPPLATHPKGRSAPSFVRALGLVRKPGMTGFLAVAFGVHLTSPFVFQVMPTYLESQGMPRAWISTALTIGQGPEILMLAALPWVFRRFGAKATLGAGITAWVVRYGTLALNPPLWVAVAGIPLHGIAIACFTVAGQIYVDGQAPREMRASAQALYLVVTAGFGSLLGSVLAGTIMSAYDGEYARVFFVPCVIDVVLLIFFCAVFRLNAPAAAGANDWSVAHFPRHEAVRGTGPRMSNLLAESIEK